MTTQMSPATGHSLLGLFNTGSFDNFASGDFLFPELTPQSHSALDTNTLSRQNADSSPSGDAGYLVDCEAEPFTAEAPLEFGNENQMYGTIEPLTPVGFDKAAATPAITKSPETTPMFPPTPNATLSQETKISTSEECGHEDDGCNPLLAATLRGNNNMVKLLVARGADLEKVDKHGKSALMIAVEKNNPALALVLLDLGADIRVVCRSGQDLFQKAAAHEEVTMLRTLLEWCRERSEKSSNPGLLKQCVNKRDIRGRTLIHTAVLQARCEVVELLLEYGADVNASSV
ncbi:hypothetical protein EKO04_011561 [Ascochyta lentis]|uniref:Uncharacterized protein n=1 Tax=Ascochyta lentis TaxID=205686 RepID=A0A8H7MD60_9PLEO|nr:hypothetical protein EKO04_011561 [Ascochyta lentis]